ncbi:MAG: leucine-rich repeat protein [Lachnospiraceae bacterium]|nr:leucine-rich repeat protein [Lachnospiraceae bacterium]MDE6251385.1 leucine-rich repeat protein [Lachnospiraceae bacterium]
MNKKRLGYIVKIACVLMFMVIISASWTDDTYAATYKNFKYEKINGGKNIEITGYKGNPSKVVIPSKISGKKVVSIGQKAFSGKSKLTSVAIPNTVKTVKAYAFFNCKKLKSVSVPSSVNRIYSFAFGYKSGRTNISGFSIKGDIGTAAYRYALYNEMSFSIKNLKVSEVYTERLKMTQTNLTWSASDADGYIVYRADSTGKSYKKIADVAGGTSYKDEALKDGSIYFYKIKPYKIVDDKKMYGSNSAAKISEWGKYNKASFELKLRNKTDMSAKQGVYYEIFVRSFADSDGDGIGDFNGVTAKLDYLKELGIEGIWLMPVNASPSYHGYDVTDYMTLNGEYGTEEEFKNMLSEAHKRGIKVIMDFVINHTSNSHPWFESAISDVHSPYRDYYRFVSRYDTDNYSEFDMSPWGSDVWQRAGDYYYYSAFYGFMPDLNYNNPKVREEIKNAAGKWLNMGIDGFRLDAAMHIYGDYEFRQMTDKERLDANIQWWNEFASYCETINPDVYLVGEAWQNDEVLAEYVQPFDTKFNFAFEQNMMSSVQEGKAVLQDGTSLAQSLQNILDEYGKKDTKYLDGIFGTNHDQNRIMSQVEGNADKARLVANIYMTLPGNPYIYYGEELGMYGSGDDENKRTPFIWSSDKSDMMTSWEADSQNGSVSPFNVQKTDENSMYNYYKKMIELRKSHKALTSGSYKAVSSGNDDVMAYIREYDGEKLIVIHNLSSESVTINLEEKNGGKVVFSNGEDNVVNGGEVTLAPYGSMIIE